MLHDIEALLYVKCCKMSAEITQAMWTSLWLAMDLAPDGLVTTELGSPSARHRLCRAIHLCSCYTHPDPQERYSRR